MSTSRSSGYLLLAHTADIQLRAWARSKDNLYTEVMYGVNEIVGPETDPEARPFQLEISIPDAEPEVELVDLVSEIVFHMYTRFARVTSLEVSDRRESGIHATCYMQPVLGFQKEIKAVTFHDSFLGKNTSGNWECSLIFDI